GASDGTRFALGAGVTIALYSAVDRVGVRLVEPWLYAAMLWLFMTSSVNVFVFTMDHFAPGSLGGEGTPGDAAGGYRRLLAGVDIPKDRRDPHRLHTGRTPRMSRAVPASPRVSTCSGRTSIPRAMPTTGSR